MQESANFCSNCGTTVKQESKISAPKEWEFTYFKMGYEQGGTLYLTHGRTEQSIRLELWENEKSFILPKIQKYLDDGWQALSDFGVNSYRFFRRQDKDNMPYLSVSSFFVELQRPARELTKLEKEIIGIWESEGDPNRGLMPIVNLALLGKAKVQNVYYEFLRNKTYYWKNVMGEEVNRGVFSDNGKGQIVLIPKNNENEGDTIDEYIRLENEKLIIVRRFISDKRLKDFNFFRTSQHKTG